MSVQIYLTHPLYTLKIVSSKFLSILMFLVFFGIDISAVIDNYDVQEKNLFSSDMIYMPRFLHGFVICVQSP